ncbi:MAG: hypothetical protein AB7O24_03645 [Kofleriaceae bacterium]
MNTSLMIVLHVVLVGCAGASARDESPPAIAVSMVTSPGGASGVPLAEAVASGAVLVSARGAGVSHVELVVVARADVALVVPSGTYFRGLPDGGFQNMIVTKTTTTQLAGGRRVTIALPTACTNFHRAAPTEDDRFVLATPDPALHQLVRCLERTAIGDADRQIHVWTLTDNVTREDVKSRRELLRPRLVDECRRRLHRSATTCGSLVEAGYAATVDKLFERRESAHTECSPVRSSVD